MSLNVEGQDCPVCKGHLFNDDDIVYCPICGAPHHRDCYNALGHCALEADHGTDRQYVRPDPSEKADEAPPPQGKKCRFCGADLAKGALFCDRCGNPVDGGSQPSRPAGQVGGMPFVIDPLGGVGQGEKIEDIPVTDMARFVAVNTPRYIPVFRRLSKKKRVSWNWAAFLLPEGWLLYRKCYGSGILFLMLSLICAVLAVPYQLAANAALSALPENATMAQMYSLLMSASLELFSPFVMNTSLLSGAMRIGYRVVCGLFGDYIYRAHAIDKIHKLRGEAGYSDLLARAGGVSLALLLAAILIVNWAPVLIASLL